MNARQRRTLERLFADPPPAEVAWDDIESLLRALGATIEQGRGSRVRITLGERRAVFHVPHPQRRAARGRLRAVRDFLHSAEVRP